jgi:Outer membrane protein beta-barrel domain
MGLEEIFKNIGKGLMVLGFSTGLILGAPVIAGADNKNNKLDEFFRGLRKIERDVDKIQQLNQEQLAQFQRHYFVCNSIGNSWAFPDAYAGIKNIFSNGEPLQLVELDPFDRPGDFENVYVYGPAGNLVYQNSMNISSWGQFWSTGINSQTLSQIGGLGNYRAAFYLDNQEMADVNFVIVGQQQSAPQPAPESQEPSQLTPTPQEPSPQPSQPVYQSGGGLNGFLNGNLGITSPSSSIVQQAYGPLFEIKAGIGGEDNNGWSFEFDLEGKFVNGSNNSTSKLADFEVPFRVAKAFGTIGEHVRPYFGAQISLDYLTETTSAYGYSYSISQLGAGLGLFGGIDIPLTKNIGLELEAMYSGYEIPMDLGDYSGNANIGGLSLDVGIKYFFSK